MNFFWRNITIRKVVSHQRRRAIRSTLPSYIYIYASEYYVALF